MKVILYAAISADGFIADQFGRTDFVGAADWVRLKQVAKHCGNVVIGRKTYEIMQKEGEFPLPSCLNVIMTSRKSLLGKGESDKVMFTNETPIGVIRHLEEKDFSKALIAGGAKVFSSFMKLNLVDELYLTVEPLILGHGLKMFNSSDSRSRLKLLDTYQLSSKEIQLHFKVNK